MPRIPSAPFARALSRPNGGRLPQAIAHRGYKAAFPENTLAAFQAAVKVGAHALETDLHLSKDKVVVLSHDGTLKRCFGVDAKIADYDWGYLSTLKTLKEPKQPMPRLLDLLEYLSQPELQHIWVLLDIKLDDDAEELLEAVAQTFASVPSARPWKDRIVMGGWNDNYLSLCQEYFPGFHAAFIGSALVFAFPLLKKPSIDFNIFQKVLPGPLGSHFLAAAKKAERNVYVWTVNQEEWMEWSIRKEVDGVITDDPKLYLEVCERWEDDLKPENAGRRRARRPLTQSLRMGAEVVFTYILSSLFTIIFFRKFFVLGKRKAGAPVT
ncbi:glycerophosphoryl diester phosphodiesterase [Thozetella sp. PMI_491]|nr:glycerophosphoryl diester phosphodiesterase [Thozetella sp. PMI_491]